MISQGNYTSNLTESIYNKLKTIVGATYSHATLGTRDVTFVAGYPPDITAYVSSLPIIILDRAHRQIPVQFEQGGNRKYTDIFHVDIIAGGFDNAPANEYMKNSLVDKVIFGFDLKRNNLTNIQTSAVEGQYQSTCYEMTRIPSSRVSVYETHHAQIVISVWTTINN